MKLDRIRFEVDGPYIQEAQQAIKNLPPGILHVASEIIVERLGEKRYSLDTKGCLFYLTFKNLEGISNMNFYRRNQKQLEEGNGKITFDCGDFQYLIPPLREKP